MKFVKLLFIACCIAMCISTNAQERTSQKIYIVNGYFFHEIPVSNKLINGVFTVKTDNGTKASCLTLSQDLPEEALLYTIPKEQVTEADELLGRYESEKGNAIGISFDEGEQLIKVGDKFPKFSATDITGKVWTNDDVAGKVMVLNCWFTGCGPCRAEMPELSTWKNEMPDVIFFSSTYENADEAKSVLEERGFNWIALVNDTQFKEYVGNNGYPMTIVVDKDGVIRQIEYGTSILQRNSIKRTIQSLR